MPTKLISVTDMQTRVDVADTLPVKYIDPHILAAQQQYIRPLLNDALYEELETEKAADALSYANQALIAELVPLITYRAYQIYLLHTGIYSTPMGLREYKEDNSDPVSAERRSGLTKYAQGQAESYTQQVLKFLDENKSDYPLYDATCETRPGYTWSISPVKRNKRYQNRLGDGYTPRPDF